MKFCRLSVASAEGSILGHNIVDDQGRRILRKGKALSGDDLKLLLGLGRRTVYVAQLDADDVDEDTAAGRLAAAASGPGIRRSQARTGRVNLYATERSLLRVDLDTLRELNRCPGVSFSTLPRHTPILAGKMVATLKVIPYALPEATVRHVEVLLSGDLLGGDLLGGDPQTRHVVWTTALTHRRVGLVVSGAPGSRQRVIDSFRGALEPRLQALGAELTSIDFVSLDEDHGEETLSQVIRQRLGESPDLLLLAGDTAIMDRYDIAPRAVEAAGAEIIAFGAPVDPGNLLLLADAQGVPIVGAPGCSRSPKQNIVDLVLPRLLAGDRLDVEDLLDFAHGGLLEDVPERPLPRSWLR